MYCMQVVKTQLQGSTVKKGSNAFSIAAKIFKAEGPRGTLHIRSIAIISSKCETLIYLAPKKIGTPFGMAVPTDRPTDRQGPNAHDS